MNLKLLILFLFICETSSQEYDEKNMLNRLIAEKKSFYLTKKKLIANFNNFAFKQLFTLNDGIPNLENRNGIYAPKGNLVSTSLLFGFKSKYLRFSAEPTIIKFDNYESENIYENSVFKYWRTKWE